MKTIGVLGGLGPRATMDFELRVHQVAQQLIPANINGGYPPMVVSYFRSVPFVEREAGMTQLPLRPHPLFLEAAAEIGRISDFIVVTSNFLHLFRSEIEAAAGCKLLSMIDLVLAEVDRRGWRHVGVPGFGDPIVYTRPLQAAGISTETISGETRANLDQAIKKVMEGREDNTSVQAAHQALDELCARDVDGIILACTEIPLLLGDSATGTAHINPLQLLARAAVESAIR